MSERSRPYVEPTRARERARRASVKTKRTERLRGRARPRANETTHAPAASRNARSSAGAASSASSSSAQRMPHWCEPRTNSVAPRCSSERSSRWMKAFNAYGGRWTPPSRACTPSRWKSSSSAKSRPVSRCQCCARAQHWHRDTGLLFADDDDFHLEGVHARDGGVHLPPYALNAFIHLEDLSDEHRGATEFVLGSHQWGMRWAEDEDADDAAPAEERAFRLAAGACVVSFARGRALPLRRSVRFVFTLARRARSRARVGSTYGLLRSLTPPRARPRVWSQRLARRCRRAPPRRGTTSAPPFCSPPRRTGRSGR